ncbi:terminase gpA endonuclease subunit [Methylobacterium aquaticum]|uniref:terminase gpA endonuclease subunit n=1 Tax=Methylobacterium aquaticum TaxID=270351 RepID=UPI003D16E51B
MYPPSAGVPGPRDPGLTPYIVAFERFFEDPRYEICALITGTQASKTDGILDVMGWRLDTRPRPQLYVGPSKDFVSEQFEPRLMKLFDEAERLNGLVARGKRNKKTRKTVNGVSVRLAWAGSATSLASDQAGDVYIDEYDKMMRGVRGEGDPFTLAKARADTYADRKIAVTSTPKRGRVETERCGVSGLAFWKAADPQALDSPIWVKWQSGTRHHWAWRCPHCADWFIPRLSDLKAPKDATPAQARRETWLCCPANGCVIEEGHKKAMNAAGVFVAPGQKILPDGILEGEPPDSTILSLWVSGLASPFVTWGERVEELMLARNNGDQEAIQGAINKAGEVYSEAPLNAPRVETVKAKRVPYAMGEVPREVMRLVAGIDVQKRELYYVVRGFGARGASWLIQAEKLNGLTDGEDVWDDLADALLTPYGGLRIEKAFIDSGFRPDKPDAGDAHRVYAFARRYDWLVVPTKGYQTRSSPLTIRKHEVDTHGKAARFSVDLAALDSDFFKSLVMSRIQTPVGRPGSFHVPHDISDLYCRHMVSEVRELKTGKPVWTSVSRENHFLDCFDPETELLTSTGWVRVDRLRGDFEFATVNLETDAIEYQRPTKLVSRHHRGEMVRIEGRRVDALVTPNHRMVTYRRNPVDPVARVTLAKDLTVWHTLKLTGEWAGEDVERIVLPEVSMEIPGRGGMFEPERSVDAGDWFEFLGWYVAEGHQRVRGRSQAVVISQNPGAKHDRIRALLDRLGFRYRVTGDRQFVVVSRQVFAGIAGCEDPGTERGAFRKRVPALVKGATPALIERFVEAAILGDGWVQDGFRTYATVSPLLADDMQELFLKLGRSANVKVREGVPYEIRGRAGADTHLQYHVSETKTAAASLRRSDNSPLFSTVDYDGMVYCVTVPNGTVVARRNGKMMVAGNCEALAAAAGYLMNVQRIPEGVMRDWDDTAPAPLPPGLDAPPPLPVTVREPPPEAALASPPPQAPPQAVAAAKSLRDSLAARMAARAGRLNR